MSEDRMSAPAHLEVRIHLPLDRFQLELDFETTAQVTGVFGPSGSGKTSLLESIAGLRRGVEGVIRLGGETWLDSSAKVREPPEDRHLGYVPQDGLLFPHLDVRRNLLAGAHRARARGLPVEATLESVCALLELEPLLEQDVGTLSGGERQRVALGRALCSGPRLLLLDEPLASLDLALRRKVLPYLRRVRRQLDLPMLLISHDPTEVQALCDDLIVLKEGQMVMRGKPAEVLTDPQVVPLEGPRGFENLVPGFLEKNGQGTSIVRLGGEGNQAIRLRTPAVEAPAGEEVLVSIPAREILLATQEPKGLSARNVLPATIASLRALEGMLLVTTTLSGALPGSAPDLTSEITPDAAEALGLAPGQDVFLILKTAGCAVLHAGG